MPLRKLLASKQVPVGRGWHRPCRRARARVVNVNHVNAGTAAIWLALVEWPTVAAHHEGVAHGANQIIAQAAIYVGNRFTRAAFGLQAVVRISYLEGMGYN